MHIIHIGIWIHRLLKKTQILFNKNNWSLQVVDEKPFHPCIKLWMNKFNGTFNNLDTWIEVISICLVHWNKESFYGFRVEELGFSWPPFFKEPCKLTMDAILQLIYIVPKVVQPMHLAFWWHHESPPWNLACSNVVGCNSSKHHPTYIQFFALIVFWLIICNVICKA
jgi:hypothetical protein